MLTAFHENTNPNDITSKRSSSRCFQGHNLRPQVTVLCTHSAIFFPPMNFFLNCLTQRGQFVHQNYATQNIGHHACLREKDDLSLSRARPYTKSRYYALKTRTSLRSRNAQCNTDKSP